MDKKEALKLVNTAIEMEDTVLAWCALGYCKALITNLIDDEKNVMVKDVIVENVEPKPTFLEVCEKMKEELKHDIIAEEEKTLYKNRAISLKDEICKRWPNTNSMIKKILHSNGIKNIEEFYEYFTIYGNWKLDNWIGLCTDDVIKFHNLYLTLNEESGCSADEKLTAYMPVDTNRSGMATRMVRYLENMDICTKSQLRWYVHNIGDIPYTKGVGDDRIDALNNKVKEELAFHAM